MLVLACLRPPSATNDKSYYLLYPSCPVIYQTLGLYQTHSSPLFEYVKTIASVDQASEFVPLPQNVLERTLYDLKNLYDTYSYFPLFFLFFTNHRAARRNRTKLEKHLKRFKDAKITKQKQKSPGHLHQYWGSGKWPSRVTFERSSTSQNGANFIEPLPTQINNEYL